MADISAKREQRVSYLILVLPAVVIYYAVMAFPVLFSCIISLTNYSGGAVFGNPAVKYSGLSNYMRIFEDEYFYLALKNNLYIVLVSVFGQIPLGFTLAYILFRKTVRGTALFQTVLYLPNVISPVVIGILFKNFYLSADGVFFEILRIFKPSAEFEISRHPIAPVLLVMLWMYTGMYVIIFLASMQKIDTKVIEAARIDGAKEAQILRFIILPALSGVMAVCAILAVSGSLKSFDLIYAMTGGGPANRTSVLSLYMYNKAFRGAPNYPLANAVSTIMIIIGFALIGLIKGAERLLGERE
ncbi:sugar ABC transporter permease [Treponema sp. OttesenSCG-928-L16]|nr:sugar ABC transporter permease [Treponema sp. OttesenSCG-928-L16]